ncbi:hypothetical protein [Umezawaea tangerina]|uniref:ABC-2 type transport system permease protein n=1 Tax=Umezawaea tangerina TaxID=84725 RepID=A0A2T0SVV7_9PSEU|nr:hypothetical protein [Umezawaea tangerina]PRY37529.1 ABC-2 type transport system permease protein [Umezawaea tangerina]
MADSPAAWFTLVRIGMLSSFEDYRRMFTWRSWLLGWLSRLVAQVLFFAMLGRLVGTVADEHYAAIGNALVLAPLGTLGVVASTSLERRLGTLHLLLLSPTDPLVVIVSRGLYWVFDGILTSLVTLGLVSVILDLDVQRGNLPLVVCGQVVLACSTYAMAVAVSGLSIRWPEARTFITTALTIVLLAGTGVNSALPRNPFLHAVLHLFPVTNGLPAVRAAVDGGPTSTAVLLGLGAECLVGLGWLVVAHVAVVGSIRRQVRTGRLTAMA